MFPACAYNGNRFRSVKRDYPPCFTQEEIGIDAQTLITDVVRLNEDGSGKIAVTTGDVSVPCVGVYDSINKKGYLVLTVQGDKNGNYGLGYHREDKRCIISITAPKMRNPKKYRWPFMVECNDQGADYKKGDCVEIPFQLFEFDASDMNAFYAVFFDHRKCMQMDCALAEEIPFETAYKIEEKKQNEMKWYENVGYYSPAVGEGMNWELGWIGGGMSSAALMGLGGELEYSRAIKTLDYIFNSQTECGLFPAKGGTNHETAGDFYLKGVRENWLLIRRTADLLLYALKHFYIMESKQEEIDKKYIDGTKKLADAFVALWEKYGQFGQFVDYKTGEIIVGNSASAGIAPAGLSEAYRYFQEEKYLSVAEESAQYFYDHFIMKGYTTGGPGEILQCVDSESAFGLLESFVTLYDITKNSKRLEYAKHAAYQCSSWVVPYNYHFPAYSEFGKWNVPTTGTVFANIQNKHSAPGICTLSGNSLLKLYRFTKDSRFLELLGDIARAISKCMSRADKPIYSWDVPKDASLLRDDTITAERELLPFGFICERVNMSDWESERCIGGVFNGSCWSEVSLLMTILELPSIYVDFENKNICAFDDISAELDGEKIILKNNTPYDAHISILVENEKELPMYYRKNFQNYFIQSGESLSLCKDQLKSI